MLRMTTKTRFNLTGRRGRNAPFLFYEKTPGLSQKAASLAAGLSENYVANVERNRVSPTVRRLDKVLNVYGYELEVVKR